MSPRVFGWFNFGEEVQVFPEALWLEHFKTWMLLSDRRNTSLQIKELLQTLIEWLAYLDKKYVVNWLYFLLVIGNSNAK